MSTSLQFVDGVWPTIKALARRVVDRFFEKKEKKKAAAACNGLGVVQRKDRQKKEFHDQSDYR